MICLKNNSRKFSFLAKLQRCREEREKIIREKEPSKPSSAKTANPSKNYYFKYKRFHFLFLKNHPMLIIDQYLDGKKRRFSSYSNFYIYRMYRTHTQTKFNPSNSLLHGLNQPTTINTSQNDTNSHLPPRSTSATRPIVSNSILKPSLTQCSSCDGLRTSSSAGFLDDVRRMVNK